MAMMTESTGWWLKDTSIDSLGNVVEGRHYWQWLEHCCNIHQGHTLGLPMNKDQYGMVIAAGGRSHSS